MGWIEFLRLVLVADKNLNARQSAEPISLEQLAKILTGASAACFAIGVICTSIYFASVSLRPFEPLSFQQIFLGALYLSIAAIALVIPARLGKHSVVSWTIQALAVLYLIFDNPFTTHLAYLLGASVAHIHEHQFFQMATTKIEGVFWFVIAAIAFRSLANRLAIVPSTDAQGMVSRLSIGITASLLVFATNVYPRIPLALGGGSFPIVHIEFADDAPYSVTSRFDVSLSNPKYQGHRYYAHLIHREEEVLYLTSTFWFGKSVIEVRSKDVLMLEFSDFNPTTYTLPEK